MGNFKDSVVKGTLKVFGKIKANIIEGNLVGNARIRNSGSLKFGGSEANDAKFELKYNDTTKSLDINSLL